MRSFLMVLYVLFLASCASHGKKSDATKPMKLVWSDEFNGSGKPDTTKWVAETGFIRNREAQYYTESRNVEVKDGCLVITARKERVPNVSFTSGTDKNWRRNRPFAEYSSGSIQTRGKAEWTYGRIEVRAKLPAGRGTWPAIWLLGANRAEVGWPKCGEMDVMESVGFAPDTVRANVHTQKYNHTKNSNKGVRVKLDKPYCRFHVYAVNWTPEKLDFYVDSTKILTYPNEHSGTDEWPFDSPAYLKLNLAIGGALGGKHGIDDRIFPQEFLIDYVRVYQ